MSAEPTGRDELVRLLMRLHQRFNDYGGSKDHVSYAAAVDGRHAALLLEADAKRIAELEALVHRAVASQSGDHGECHECWAPPEADSHDKTCWVGDAVRALSLLDKTP